MPAIAYGEKLTLPEVMRRTNPDGTMADLVDTIKQENRILEDLVFLPCNNKKYHQGSLVASRPAGTERGLSEGVTEEATVTETQTEPTCMLSGLSRVDYKIVGGNMEVLAQEHASYVTGMLETLVSRFFDGNRSTDIRRINGIHNRTNYNTLTNTSRTVFDNAGGSASVTDNKTSMYFIQHGPRKVYLIYPDEDDIGDGNGPIKSHDFGLSLIDQAGTSGARHYPAWQMWFNIDFGLFIADYRCIKRVVNISTSNIDGVDDFSIDENVLIDAHSQLEYGGAGTVIYCNRTVLAQVQKRANEKGNAFYTQVEGEGPFARPVNYWNGIPIKRCDAITDAQADVT
jgi:hypothetical protein